MKAIELQSHQLYQNYRANVEKFIQMASKEGVAIRTGNEAAWTEFLHLPLPMQNSIASYFKIYKDVAEEVIQEKESLTNSLQFSWRMIRRLGFSPPADLFEKLTNEDIIEIHLPELIQIFRNLNFFNVTSYTFEELMHYPYFVLFSRNSDNVTKALMDECNKVFSGNIRSSFFSSAPEHIGSETRSCEKINARIKQKVMSPLFDSTGKPAAILSSLNVTILKN